MYPTQRTASTGFSRRSFMAGGLAASATALLSGCGAGGSAASSSDKSLTIVADPGGPLQLSKVAELYKEKTGVEINFVSLPYDGVYTRYTSEFSSGNFSMDIAMVDAVWLPTFGSKLEPLDELFTADVKADLFHSVFDEGSVDGKMIGMPAWMNAQILYYRKDLFEDPNHQAAFKSRFGYDLAVPADWDTFRDVGQYFVIPPMFGTDVPGGVETEFLSTVYQAGAENIVLDGDNNVIIDDDYHVQALKYYADLSNVDKVAPPGAASVGWTEAQNFFNQGATAMTRFWLHQYKQVPSGSPVQNNLGSAPMIAGPGGIASIPGDWYLTIPQGAPKADQAKEFIQFAYENQQLGLDTDLGLISRRSVMEEYSTQPGYEPLGALVTTLDSPQSKNRPKVSSWQQMVDQALVPLVQQAVVPGADYAALLSEAKTKIETIVA